MCGPSGLGFKIRAAGTEVHGSKLQLGRTSGFGVQGLGLRLKGWRLGLDFAA